MTKTISPLSNQTVRLTFKSALYSVLTVSKEVILTIFSDNIAMLTGEKFYQIIIKSIHFDFTLIRLWINQSSLKYQIIPNLSFHLHQG